MYLCTYVVMQYSYIHVHALGVYVHVCIMYTVDQSESAPKWCSYMYSLVPLTHGRDKMRGRKNKESLVFKYYLVVGGRWSLSAQGLSIYALCVTTRQLDSEREVVSTNIPYHVFQSLFLPSICLCMDTYDVYMYVQFCQSSCINVHMHTPRCT